MFCVCSYVLQSIRALGYSGCEYVLFGPQVLHKNLSMLQRVINRPSSSGFRPTVDDTHFLCVLYLFLVSVINLFRAEYFFVIQVFPCLCAIAPMPSLRWIDVVKSRVLCSDIFLETFMSNQRENTRDRPGRANCHAFASQGP